MTPTLEQELEALIADADYRVSIFAGDNYLKLRLIYLPKLSVRGEGAFAYIANGVIAEQHWHGRSSRRRWRRAAKWVQAEIAGHRELIRAVGQT